MGFINQLITGGAPPCMVQRFWNSESDQRVKVLGGIADSFDDSLMILGSKDIESHAFQPSLKIFGEAISQYQPGRQPLAADSQQKCWPLHQLGCSTNVQQNPKLSHTCWWQYVTIKGFHGPKPMSHCQSKRGNQHAAMTQRWLGGK